MMSQHMTTFTRPSSSHLHTVSGQTLEAMKETRTGPYLVKDNLKWSGKTGFGLTSLLIWQRIDHQLQTVIQGVISLATYSEI